MNDRPRAEFLLSRLPFRWRISPSAKRWAWWRRTRMAPAKADAHPGASAKDHGPPDQGHARDQRPRRRDASAKRHAAGVVRIPGRYWADDRGDPPAWQDPGTGRWSRPTGTGQFRSRGSRRLGRRPSSRAGEIVRGASQHLNIEIGLALWLDRWVGADYWEQATDSSLTLDNVLSRSDVVVMGIDGGGSTTFREPAVLGREKETRRWLLWSRGWAHQSVLERRKGKRPTCAISKMMGSFPCTNKFGLDIAAVSQLAKRIDDKRLLHAVALLTASVRSWMP